MFLSIRTNQNPLFSCPLILPLSSASYMKVKVTQLTQCVGRQLAYGK